MERELILAVHMKSTDDSQRTVDDSFADGSPTMHHAGPMTTYRTRCTTRTSSVPDFVDVTDDIVDAIVESSVTRGRATVFAIDEGSCIVVNERESGLLLDLRKTIERITPADTSTSHPIVGSSSVVLPIEDGKLQLGTWQRVLLVELIEACPRSVDIQIIGER